MIMHIFRIFDNKKFNVTKSTYYEILVYGLYEGKKIYIYFVKYCKVGVPNDCEKHYNWNLLNVLSNDTYLFPHNPTIM